MVYICIIYQTYLHNIRMFVYAIKRLNNNSYVKKVEGTNYTWNYLRITRTILRNTRNCVLGGICLIYV